MGSYDPQFTLLVPPRQVVVVCAVNHLARELYWFVSARVEVLEGSFVIFTRFGIKQTIDRNIPQIPVKCWCGVCTAGATTSAM